MKHHFGRKSAACALSALFCFSLGFTALSACGESGGGTVAQTKTEDSASIAYTALSEVELTDSYGANALSKEYTYLAETLDADKLLYYFYVNADLKDEADANSGYGGGWESSLIGGHTMGHYLSALALSYANAGTNSTQKTALKNKIDYIVGELKKCQNNAEEAGSQAGFLWGAKYLTTFGGNYEKQFDNVESGLANISSQAWVPWYTMHKIIAGLYDVTVYTGSETAKGVLLNLCDWVYNRVTQWSDSTQKTVLSIEYGGMNDILYSVYALTGEEKYAVAAHKFDEETLFSKVLAEGANYLANLHANTTIPKILGALNRYITCNGKTIDGETVNASTYLTVAELFWERVVEHHTYVTGGNSEDEHFGRDDVLDGTGYSGRDNVNCETCNTYNMLKLSRALFCITGDVKYLDYYENTYINAIWSSQNPETGMTMYFQPMATGYFKVYSTETTNFWCCTGSGMESMSKLNDSIYYTAGNATYVSMYLSSTYTSSSVTLTQTADLNSSGEVSISVTKGKTILRLRVPDWATSFELTKNGKTVETDGTEDFVSVSVSKGDKLSLSLGMEITAYNLPDAENCYAFKYGPYVLSAEYGEVTSADTTTSHGVSVVKPAVQDFGSIGTDTLNIESGTLENYIENINDYMVNNGDGTFTLTGCDIELTYSYHYLQYTHRYGIYIYFIGTDVEVVDTSTYTLTELDSVQPGYGQFETDGFHNMQDNGSFGTTTDEDVGGSSRYATADGSFSYRLAVDKSASNNYLRINLSTYDAGKSLKITSGSTVLFEETLRYGASGSSVDEGTYERLIAIPSSLVSSAESVTVDGETRDMITITVSSGVEGETSARLHISIQTALVTFKTEAQNANYTASTTSSTVLYFVDCGDYDTSTVSSGDTFGQYNSVTEQLYGIDLITGKYWGIVDESNPASGTAGSASEYGISTANTWAYEYDAVDGSDKTVTNRYTKNQYESDVARNLHYLFELEDGTYTVKMYFSNPWNCSSNPCVAANGTSVLTNAATGQEVSFTVTVSGGSLLLDISSSDKCINLCYIVIESA